MHFLDLGACRILLEPDVEPDMGPDVACIDEPIRAFINSVTRHVVFSIFFTQNMLHLPRITSHLRFAHLSGPSLLLLKSRVCVEVFTEESAIAGHRAYGRVRGARTVTA